MFRRSIALLLLVGASACQDAGGVSDPRSGPPCPTNLEELKTQVFGPSCVSAGCHGSADRAAGLNLQARDVEFQLFGRDAALCSGETRVIAGNSAGSHLIGKLRGTTACGEAMPADGLLPPETVECVASWIDLLDLSTICETCGGAACVDLQIDPRNCGTCGQACGGTAICLLGTCACPGDQVACESGCADLDDDPANCGACETDCEGLFCLQGACSEDCGTLTECGGTCVDPSTSSNHCGVCDNACAPGSSCVDGECQCGGVAVSFADEVQPIFTAGCASKGCHDGGRGRPGGPGGGSTSLDLREGSSFQSLLEETTSCGPVVAPGDPAGSILIGKLTGEELCSGSQMPKGADPLDPALVETIAAWICQGAPDN